MKLFRRKKTDRVLPDLSRNYMDPSIPPKQRELVNVQLKAMRKGESPAHFRVFQEVMQIVLSEEKDRVLSLLDAGCASAYYSEIVEYFFPKKFQYTGSDFNQAMLQMAKSYYPAVSVTRMDLRNLGWREGGFDVVLSGAVLVHIKEWQEALKELARVARKWLVLHRVVIALTNPTSIRAESHYDVDVYRVFIHEKDLLDLARTLNLQPVTRVDCDEGVEEGIAGFTYLFKKE